MLLITLKMVLLLSSIVIPLSTKRKKAKSFKIDTNTKDALYAINENGLLEKITRPSLQVEDTDI